MRVRTWFQKGCSRMQLQKAWRMEPGSWRHLHLVQDTPGKNVCSISTYIIFYILILEILWPMMICRQSILCQGEGSVQIRLPLRKASRGLQARRVNIPTTMDRACRSGWAFIHMSLKGVGYQNNWLVFLIDLR